jgi:hypothetical protein
VSRALVNLVAVPALDECRVSTLNAPRAEARGHVHHANANAMHAKVYARISAIQAMEVFVMDKKRASRGGSKVQCGSQRVNALRGERSGLNTAKRNGYA